MSTYYKNVVSDSCSWQGILDTTMHDKKIDFSLEYSVSSINKAECHVITEILLKKTMTLAL